MNSGNCSMCKVGKYQHETGQASCLPCIPGPIILQSGSCINCHKVGTPAILAVPVPAVQVYSLLAEARRAKCSAGKAGIGEGGTCADCPQGQFRGSSDPPTHCIKCLTGETTKFGLAATSCDKCDVGQFGKYPGKCVQCPQGLYSDGKGQTKCFYCQPGKIANNRSTACEKPAYKVPEDCMNGEYLDDTSENNKDWSCRPCPKGADCTYFSHSCANNPNCNQHHRTV